MAHRLKWLLAMGFALSVVTSGQAQAPTELYSVFGDPRIDAPVVGFTLSDEETFAADKATFSLAIVADASTSEEALRMATARTTAVIAALRARGLTDADFRPSTTSVSQRRNNSRGNAVRGYIASTRIRVETSNIEQAGVMVAAAVAAGATDSEGPSFDREDLTTVLRPLRERLYQQGLAQANDYARAAGYARVRPIAMSERITGGERYGYADRLSVAAADAAMDASADATIEETTPPTPTTDVTKQLTLQMVFRLER